MRIQPLGIAGGGENKRGDSEFRAASASDLAARLSMKENAT